MNKTIIFTIFTFLLVGITSAQVGVNHKDPANPPVYESQYGTFYPTQSADATEALVLIITNYAGNMVHEALLAKGYNITYASSWSDFDTKLASGMYHLAVVFAQNTYPIASIPGLQNFLDNDGKMIYCDWSQENAYANLFEASFTGVTNQTQVTITDPELAEGLSNPFTISNLSWGVFSTGLQAIGNGEVLATFGNGDAAIVRGNNGNTIMLGYLSNTPPADMRQALFENLLDALTPPPPPPIPLSNLALYLVLALAAGFAVWRLHRVI